MKLEGKENQMSAYCLNHYRREQSLKLKIDQVTPLLSESERDYKDRIIESKESLSGKDGVKVVEEVMADCELVIPTEDDKLKLVDETRLQLKQIKNQFINHRKRNWHSNSSAKPYYVHTYMKMLVQMRTIIEIENGGTNLDG
ncbi:hypothetical protein LXL04_012081 [Taraxacum kok-saghyz]